MSEASPALLLVDRLQTHFRTPSGVLRAVQGVTFSIGAGETVAVVGESGCGKSVTAMSILRLLPDPPARIAGRISFNGRDLLRLPESALRKIRGNEISMIFQEPMSSLNPVLSVAWQIGETLELHKKLRKRAAFGRARDMLALVGIPEPERVLEGFPHQLSGGMRQRVMIAMAVACDPKLLIADEPTTALDVTIQAQILELMRELKRRVGAAIMLITHDLGVVAEMAERVVVLYAGRTVEIGPVAQIFARPLHPYTQGLLRAVPRLGAAAQPPPAAGGLRMRDPKRHVRARLAEIPGQVPDLRLPIEGCAFAPRCARASEICRRVAPALVERRPGHAAACHHPGVSP